FSTKRKKPAMTYRQITYAERYTLGLLRQGGLAPAAIARVLGRHRSTIGREVRRNGTPRDDCYRPQLAEWYARGRRSRSRRGSRPARGQTPDHGAPRGRRDQTRARALGGGYDARRGPGRPLRLEPGGAQDGLPAARPITAAHQRGREPARAAAHRRPAARRADDHRR